MTSQPSLLHLSNEKVAGTKSEKNDDVPCSSNANDTEIESNTDRTKLSEILDIGLYIGKSISDNKLKYNLLKKPWQPSISYKFPVESKKKSKFQLSWFERFSWLVYSKNLEGVFCKMCVLFVNETFRCSEKANLLVNKPFIKWKNALEYFTTHSNSDYHKLSTLKAEEFVKIIEDTTFGTASQVDSFKKNQDDKNRLTLIPIIETIIFCGRQELDMRGHKESEPIFNCGKDNNDGHFRSLLRFRALSGDLTLKTHLMNSSEKSIYISPIIQNEIIQICGSLIQKEIVLKINQAKFFTILVDDTCNISHIQQMSLCVRYIDNGCIREDFIEFVPIYDVNGSGIAYTIIKEIGKLGLKIENLIGQGYDGASAMSGLYDGVQKYIRDKIPHALYVHCAAHSLNLAIGKSCTIPEIRNCIGSASKIINFFRKSTMRTAVLKESIKKHIPTTQQSTLIKMCETHWVDSHHSILRFKDLYEVIAYALNDLESNHDLETSQSAFQLSKTHRSSQFIIALYVIEKLFEITLPLCNALQKKNCDLSECYENVANCIQVISSIRINAEKEFQNLFLEVEKRLSILDETIQIPQITERLLSPSNMPAESPEQYYNQTIFIPFIDYFKNQLIERFSKQNENIIPVLQKLIPNLLNKFKPIYNDFEECIHFYKHVLPSYNTFEPEFKVWTEKWKNVPQNQCPNSAIDTFNKISVDLFPNIWCLMSILVTLPVSTASPERFFSTLKKLKSYLRNSTSENRQKGLALMSIHRNVSIDTEEVVDNFANLPRK